MKCFIENIDVKKLKRFMVLISIFGILSFISSSVFADWTPPDPSTTDLFAIVKDWVSKNFGQGSAVEYFLYVAEAISAFFVYHKSKNVMSLVSIPIMITATYAAFKVIG